MTNFMKNIKSYILSLAALGSLAFTGCNMDFDPVPVKIPEATLKPNTTLLELKTKYWQDATNYAEEIGLNENGDSIIIHGRVISSDADGNIFKSLVIQDETCALAFSINAYNLYLDYRPGQEIVINATGLEIGKYNGLLQMGKKEWYEKQSVWEVSFMAPEAFRSHAQLNGLPEPAKIDTIQINSFAELPSDPEGLCRFQSQLVRFNNVHFANGGKSTFSTYKSSGVSENIVDTEGASLAVRTSGYSKFWNKMLPEGQLDLVCILGYYGTQGWQLSLIDYAGCMNIGNATEAVGTKNKPYTVAEAIAAQADGKTPSGWTTGYIVGTVAPEVTSISSSADIEWGADATLNNTLVLGPSADCKDIAQCLVIDLPQGSKLRQYAALRENPSNLGKQMWIYGKLSEYMGTWGITGNNGSADLFRIDGVEIGGGSAAAGDGSKEKPYNVSQVQGGATGTAWITGYIVGWVEGMTLAEGAHFDLTGTVSQTNILVAATPEETDYTKCVPVQLPTGTVRSSLNLATNPGNLGKQVSLYGSLEKYFGSAGMKTVTEFVLGEGGSQGGGDTPNPPSGGDGTEAKPYTVSQVQGGATGTGVWTGGYIVGWVEGMTLAEGAHFDLTGTVSQTNILLAATPNETDFNKCIPVQLPSGSVRSGLNLSANPGNLGKYVILQGSLEKYFGAAGVKTVTAFKLTDAPSGGGGGGDTPNPPAGGDGTKEKPYTLAQAAAFVTAGTPTKGWYEGYIVGWVEGQVYETGGHFDLTGTVSKTNILVASTANETNITKCVPVQLPSGAVRTGLNLADNPGNLGKKVLLNGSAEKYFNVTGIKTVTEFELK